MGGRGRRRQRTLTGGWVSYPVHSRAMFAFLLLSLRWVGWVGGAGSRSRHRNTLPDDEGVVQGQQGAPPACTRFSLVEESQGAIWKQWRAPYSTGEQVARSAERFPPDDFELWPPLRESSVIALQEYEAERLI